MPAIEARSGAEPPVAARPYIAPMWTRKCMLGEAV